MRFEIFVAKLIGLPEIAVKLCISAAGDSKDLPIAGWIFVLIRFDIAL